MRTRYPAAAGLDGLAEPADGAVRVPPPTPTPGARPSSWRARMRPAFVTLGEHDFRVFWLGMLVSVTGTWMQMVAQGWLILQLTNSPFMLGVAAAVRSVPVLVLALPAGFAADRFDRRLIVLLATIVGFVASALLAILTIAGAIDVATVLLIAAILGVTNAFEMPARQSYVSEIAGAGNLANAIALNSLLFNSARIVGPALAGVVVAAAGPGWAFALNSLSYLAFVAGLLLIRRIHVPRIGVAARNAVGEVVGYLRAEPRITALLALLAAETIFASGHLILGPSLAQDLGQGAEGLGVLLSATGVGAVVGGLRLAASSDRTERWRVLLTAGLALAVALVGVGMSSSYAVTLLCFVAAGWGMVSFNASSNTIIQTIAPDRLRGRIMSLYTLVLLGLMPAGGLFLGALADRLGSGPALGVGGALFGVLIGASFWFVRPLRRV